jgi:hypothetical protein
VALPTYISRLSFEAERPSRDSKGAEVFWIPPNSELTDVEVPQASEGETVTSLHRVKFQYGGAQCSASLAEFFEAGMCLEKPAAKGE